MSEIVRGSAVLALLFVFVGSFLIGMDGWVNGAFMRRRDRLAGRAVGVAFAAVVWTFFAFGLGSIR